MNIAITIGAYKMPDFVKLNILQCRRLFPGCPILVSDDNSGLQGLADELDAGYASSGNRMSHCSGDWQAFINAGVWALENDCEIALKLSQRFIPLDGFPPVMSALESKSCVIPGRMSKIQAARPSSRFYSVFPVLTDCVAWKPSKLSPLEMMNAYKSRFTAKHDKGTALVEMAWHDLILHHFKDDALICPELANHTPMQPKLYLRKAQSTQHEYSELAKSHGFKGSFDTREWSHIEGKNYVCRPKTV